MSIISTKDYRLNDGDRIKFDGATTEMIVQPIIVTTDEGWVLNIDLKVIDKETRNHVGARGFSLNSKYLEADEPQIANRVNAVMAACEKYVKRYMESINENGNFTR